MADVDYAPALAGANETHRRRSRRFVRWLASPRFQAVAARTPVLRRLVAQEGEAMFDIVAGFCHAQLLQAFVALDIPEMLLDEELTVESLSQASGVPVDRMTVLLRGAAALNLLRQRTSGHYRLTVRGAALAGVPGLADMIRHHDVLYRDLSDPVAFFRGEVETELAGFWPYVFGADGATDPSVTATYSALMADSQSLVAADTLATGCLDGVTHLMDVGGGSGAFLAAAGTAYPRLAMTLFDLPVVLSSAPDRLHQAGIAGRVALAPGSFREDALPSGADAISLVRVLYDHGDDTVAHLLQRAFQALPSGGRLIISEPMTGGARPTPAGDVYFAIYCMAMRTGRARSSAEIALLAQSAGFAAITQHKPRRAYITSVVTCVKPT